MSEAGDIFWRYFLQWKLIFHLGETETHHQNRRQGRGQIPIGEGNNLGATPRENLYKNDGKFYTYEYIFLQIPSCLKQLLGTTVFLNFSNLIAGKI